MGRVFLIVLSLITLFGANATELVTGNFHFDLEGHWEVSENSGTITAVQKAEKKAFIVTIYYPNSIQEGSEMLIELEHYLSNLEQQTPHLKKVKGEVLLSKNGAPPWKLFGYEGSQTSGFFIGACLGSSAGLIMITFEGSDEFSVGARQLDEILSSMNFIKT